MLEVQHVVTAGNADPDGPPDHENNVWIVGDDQEVIVIDPAHDAQAVAEAVGNRRVRAILLTHGHWDHVRAAPEFAKLVDAPVYLSNADRFLWEESHDEISYESLDDGQEFGVAGSSLLALSTPGHTPGSTSFYARDLNTVFSGDTLFEGGPGATRWDYSDFETILDSIKGRLFTLGDDVTVHTGHGPSTSIDAEQPHLQEWIDRGW